MSMDQREHRRDLWKLACKGGRLYFGDYIQQVHRRMEEQQLPPPFKGGEIPVPGVSGDFLFRTIFFSSGTNCARKWCSIDWAISVRERRNSSGNIEEYEFGGFKELGRSEG